MATLQAERDIDLKIVHLINYEQQLHRKYASYKMSGEWFYLPPYVLKELIDSTVE